MLPPACWPFTTSAEATTWQQQAFLSSSWRGAVQIFSGRALTPLSHPLPFFAYPFLAATLFGLAALPRGHRLTSADHTAGPLWRPRCPPPYITSDGRTHSIQAHA